MRFAFADCTLGTQTQMLTRGGAPVPVEPQVFDLIAHLAANPGRLITKDELIEVIWSGRIVSDSAISARIAAARKAVGDDGKRQAVIATVARRGVRFVSDITGKADAAMPRRPEPTPAPERKPAPEPDIPQRIRYTTNARGQSLAYSVTGAGSPVVRVGYNHTHLEEEWRAPHQRAYFQDIAAHHTLIRFDPAGVGLSEPAPVTVDFDQMAEDIVAVIRASGFERAALISVSGGALSAARVAARYPDVVSRWVILGGYVEGRQRRQPDAPPDAIRALFAEGWRTDGSAMVPAYLWTYFPEGPLEAVQDFARITQASSTRDQALAIRDASNAATIAEVLPQVRCPTLLFHGRRDGVHPLSEAQRLAAGIPDAELIVLETANLMPLPGQPEYPRMMAAMLAFLADADGTG